MKSVLVVRYNTWKKKKSLQHFLGAQTSEIHLQLIATLSSTCQSKQPHIIMWNFWVLKREQRIFSFATKSHDNSFIHLFNDLFNFTVESSFEDWSPQIFTSFLNKPPVAAWCITLLTTYFGCLNDVSNQTWLLCYSLVESANHHLICSCFFCWSR